MYLLKLTIFSPKKRTVMNSSTPIFIEQSNIKDQFIIQFQGTSISICVPGIMNLLSNIQQKDSYLIDLGLLHSTQGCSLRSLNSKPIYRLCFGRTFLLLSEQEMVQFMSQIWDTNPMLMYWVLSEEPICS